MTLSQRPDRLTRHAAGLQQRQHARQILRPPDAERNHREMVCAHHADGRAFVVGRHRLCHGLFGQRTERWDELGRPCAYRDGFAVRLITFRGAERGDVAEYVEPRWVGRRDLSAAELEAQPKLNPILITAGSLGLNLPDRDMMVSPQHRMLFTGARAEVIFGENEVLVAASYLDGQKGIHRIHPVDVSYIHVMFDQHEIIRANGCWTESYQPGALSLGSMHHDQREELLSLFPALVNGTQQYPAARLSLKAHEARVLLAA